MCFVTVSSVDASVPNHPQELLSAYDDQDPDKFADIVSSGWVRVRIRVPAFVCVCTFADKRRLWIEWCVSSMPEVTPLASATPLRASATSFTAVRRSSLTNLSALFSS